MGIREILASPGCHSPGTSAEGMAVEGSGAMMCAKSVSVSPKASNDPISRSKESDGSPRSILATRERRGIACELQRMTDAAVEHLIGHRTCPSLHVSLPVLDDSFAASTSENLALALRYVFNRGPRLLGIAHP
jgi:hypothetical protein